MWTQAVHFFQEQDYNKAYEYYAGYKKVKCPNVFDIAFEATIYVGLNKSKDAKNLFSTVIKKIENYDFDENSEYYYLLNYTKMYISLIDKDDNHIFYLKKAEAIDVTERIKETMPLPRARDLNF